MHALDTDTRRGRTLIGSLLGMWISACGPAEAKLEAQTPEADVQPAPQPSPRAAGEAGREALIGCWDMSVDMPLGRGEGKLCFARADDGELSARLLIKNEWRPATSVHAEPGHVELVVDAPVGEATMRADYTATSMTGTLDAKLGQRTFRAQRANEDPDADPDAGAI